MSMIIQHKIANLAILLINLAISQLELASFVMISALLVLGTPIQNVYHAISQFPFTFLFITNAINALCNFLATIQPNSVSPVTKPAQNVMVAVKWTAHNVSHAYSILISLLICANPVWTMSTEIMTNKPVKVVTLHVWPVKDLHLKTALLAIAP